LAVGSHIPVLPYFEGPEGPKREKRFWEKVAIGSASECWDWQASSASSGYGRFKVASYVTLHANRVAWALENQREPGELIIRHACDRPACCNPAHLLIGTVAENNNDKLERGRFRPGDQRGIKNPMARLSEGDVIAIVGLIRRGHNNTQISAHYPVGHSLVSRIRTGRSWQREAAKAEWPPALAWLERNGLAAPSKSGAAA
jgi:hypothetical protein